MAEPCTACGGICYDENNVCVRCGFFLNGLAPGIVLNNRYEIISPIRAGGMGAIYRAFDRVAKQNCAVKEMFYREDLSEDLSSYMFKRFMEEAKLLSLLNHPSIPGIIDYFSLNKNYYYLVMDYIEGRDLYTHILDNEGEGFPEKIVLNWAIQICDVLHYLHNRPMPILHRDLNPANLILREKDNRIILVDFGLARAINPDTAGQKTSVGSMAYTSIEQCQGHPEPRSDIYSLGATMHFLLTAQGNESFDVPPVREIRPDVSPWMEQIIQKALALLPHERFASAKEMYRVLTGEIELDQCTRNEACGYVNSDNYKEGTYIEFDLEQEEPTGLPENEGEGTLDMAKNEQGLFAKLFSKIKGAKPETPEKQVEDVTYELLLIEGDEPGKTFELSKGTVAIGRRLPGDTRTNDIIITDMEATISTEQARISWNPEYNIHMLNIVGGTKNPTIIEGRIINGPTLLQEGNHIVMGKNVMIYQRKTYQEMIIQQTPVELPGTKISLPGIEVPVETFIPPEEEDMDLIDTGYMLKVISGLEEGKRFDLNRPLISIGKLTAVEKKGWILLDSSFVSVDQATFKWMSKEKKIGIVHTKGATNPTFVNNKEISHQEFTMLEQGDVIRIGNIKMIVGRSAETKEDPRDSYLVDKAPSMIEDSESHIFHDTDVPLNIVGGKHSRVDSVELPVHQRGIIKSSSGSLPSVSPVARPEKSYEQSVSGYERIEKSLPKTPRSTNYLPEEQLVDYYEKKSDDFRIPREESSQPPGMRRASFIPREEEKLRDEPPQPPGMRRASFMPREDEREIPQSSGLRRTPLTFRPRPVPLPSLKPKDIDMDDDDDDDEDDDRTIMDQTMATSWKDAHKFKVISGPDEGRVFIVSKDMIEGKLIIGNKGKIRKDIELSDDSLSNCYASLAIEQDWLCINLEDESGDVLINDMPVMKKGLEPGDLIEIGNTIMEYSFLGLEATGKVSSSIEAIEGFDKGKIFPLTKNVSLIGRKSKKASNVKEVELSEKDRSISRSHARIEKRDKEYYLINEKDDNITILNGVQVTEPRPLVDGDKIKLGTDTVLLFRESKVPLVPREKKSLAPGEKIDFTHTTPQSMDEDMVFIPAGMFWMGVDHIECDANPMNKIHIEAFYIDRYPVTNFQYEDFVRVTGYEPKGNWKEYFTAGKEYFPVTGISYDDADAYAYWVGKRLPTEAEWEKAARGEEGLLYPWGTKWDASKVCSKEGGRDRSSQVDSYPEGQSPYGVMHMLGNVWEWTADYYCKYPYEGPHPVGEDNKEVSIRGGDWLTSVKDIGAAVRSKIFPYEFGTSIGFRCAKNA